EGPQGFMVEKDVESEGALENGEVLVTPAHFHRIRQFQLVVRGKAARIGKNATPAFSFHYIDPSSPYGPLFAGGDGISCFTLRPKPDRGAYFVAKEGEKLRGRAGRNVVVSVEPKPLPGAGVERDTLIEPHEDSLAAYRLRLAPNEAATGPDPAE